MTGPPKTLLRPPNQQCQHHGDCRLKPESYSTVKVGLPVGHRSHTRISYDSLWIACDRLSQGIFNLVRLKKNVQLAACYSSFSSKSMSKTITVDGEWKGVRGGKCGKPTSNSLSFPITKSVTTKHPVDVTSPHIARSCRPMLQLHYRRQSDGRTDSLQYATSAVGVCGRRRDGQRPSCQFLTSGTPQGSRLLSSVTRTPSSLAS